MSDLVEQDWYDTPVYEDEAMGYIPDTWSNDMLMENGLSVVTVNKFELLNALNDNLAKHEAELSEAKADFQVALKKRLASMLKDVKAGKEINLNVGISPPPDNRKSYQRVIHMLGMSVAEQIQITEQQYANYVLDEWNWKGQFHAVTSAYKSR